MIRILMFVLVVFALGLGFAWLADRPGEIAATFGGYRYQVSLIVAAAVTAAIVAGVMILWWLLKALWNSPKSVSRYFRSRRRDRGYQALSTGMIAAGAGDAALARKMNKQAVKLIRADQEPLIHLLDAQASLLEGDHATARAKFEAMVDDPETRLLGLRGLFLEAHRLGDMGAARHYAGRAGELAPQLGWAAESTLEEKTETGDWDGALRLVEAQKSSLDKPAFNRRRAVLLTAKSMALLDTDPLTARNAALEAHRLVPDFVPAALAAARALFRNNDIRKGAKILEASWKHEPHPEVADLYLHARPGDALRDRLHRAEKLQGYRQNNAESSLAVARAALEAHEPALARDAADTAIRLRPSESAYLLRADIEEAETGDNGRIRQWLGKALRAPRDAAWVADGFVSEHWAPVSPVTGRLDAFEWRAPMERMGQLIEAAEPATIAAPALAAPAFLPSPPPAPVAVNEAELDVATAEPRPEDVPPAKPTDSEPPDTPHAPHAANAPAYAATVSEPAMEAEPPQGQERATTSLSAPPPLPDDPGVDPSDPPPPTRGFRLF